MQTDSILTGDCQTVLSDIDSNSVHSCVTDPPYGLAFMGKSWDDFEPKEYQEWCEEWAKEVKRVLKPGGHLLAFSGNRTHHRLFTGVEDAGFEIRDTITWHYGSGFPKASDISKTIDKRADADREVVREHHQADPEREPGGNALEGSKDASLSWHYEVTTPATDEAKKWEGWKTALKPATEYVVVARNPFDGATVDCVLEHGTGALNIEGCRVAGGERPLREQQGDKHYDQFDGMGDYDGRGKAVGTTDEDRYPSNVVFDADAADALDEQVGNVDGCQPHTVDDNGDREVLDDGGLGATGERVEGYSDSGGPSRYFYTSKASKSERTLDGKIENVHPTVKPQDLMEWLVKLVTREEQIVLDPFAGSGTTCKAAKELNRRFIGIEQSDEYADIARVRCNLTPNDPSIVRADGGQSGLERYE